PGQPVGAPSQLDEIAGLIPPDLVNLRPEDLRVEAEFFKSLTRGSQTTAQAETAPWPVFEPPPPPVSKELPPPPPATAPVHPAAEPRPEPPSFDVSVLTQQAVDEVPKPAERSPQTMDAGSLGPQIDIEPPTILPAGTEIRRVREVVLPAPVVLAWSLF